MVPYNKNSLSVSDKKETKRKKESSKKITTAHHIIPKSRGGNDTKDNKAIIMVYFHKKYHELFSNMTPLEALAFLETYFWNNQVKWIDDYSFNRQKYLE